MDYDIFVSEDGETGQLFADYRHLCDALAAFDELVRLGMDRRVTLYHFDTVVKNWEA